MAEAGQREKEQAISNNQYHHGVPSTSVVADGGWSKRSHKHSYNAKSEVGVIFGLATKKLLFLGIRNKYCSVCAIAEHKAESSPKYICYRNWIGSSCTMESDIVVEGFRLSERTHGVRYMKLVGDGDSSVTCKAVPYGVYVEKFECTNHAVKCYRFECTNHAVKCYRSRLEQLVKNNPQYRGKGGLTKRAIQRLTVGARVAIRLHSKDRNVTQLSHDLRNGPAHVFGDHTACSKSFCKYAEQAQEEDIEEEDTTLPTSMESSSSTEQLLPATIADRLSSIIEEETDDEPTFEEEVDAQSGYSQSLSNLPDGLFRDKVVRPHVTEICSHCLRP